MYILFILCTLDFPLCCMCLAMDRIGFFNEHLLITYQCWETSHWRSAMKYIARISAHLGLVVWSSVSQTLLWIQATWVLFNLVKILFYFFAEVDLVHDLKFCILTSSQVIRAGLWITLAVVRFYPSLVIFKL